MIWHISPNLTCHTSTGGAAGAAPDDAFAVEAFVQLPTMIMVGAAGVVGTTLRLPMVADHSRDCKVLSSLLIGVAYTETRNAF